MVLHFILMLFEESIASYKRSPKLRGDRLQEFRLPIFVLVLLFLRARFVKKKYRVRDLLLANTFCAYFFVRLSLGTHCNDDSCIRLCFSLVWQKSFNGKKCNDRALLPFKSWKTGEHRFVQKQYQFISGKLKRNFSMSELSLVANTTSSENTAHPLFRDCLKVFFFSLFDSSFNPCSIQQSSKIVHAEFSLSQNKATL
ncbi:hypothetical protein BD560DRAFT_421583 [Blakeslea trispora]|nr:hypothetical protein BD560DRAFT_421583 [Blakeslea trispora]